MQLTGRLCGWQRIAAVVSPIESARKNDLDLGACLRQASNACPNIRSVALSKCRIAPHRWQYPKTR
jgi:hypothetical protein